MDGSNTSEKYAKKQCNTATSPQFKKYNYGFFDFDSLDTAPPTDPNEAINIGYFTFDLSIPHFEREVNIDTIFLRKDFNKKIIYRIDGNDVLQFPFTGSSSQIQHPCTNDDLSIVQYHTMDQYFRGRFSSQITNNQMILRVSEEKQSTQLPKCLLISSIQVNINTCYPTCKTCKGPSNNQCLSCSQGQLSVNNSCNCTDSSQFFQNGECVAKCDEANGYFQKFSSEKECHFINKLCLKWNQSTQKCETCLTPYLPQNDQCVQTCSAGFEKVQQGNSINYACQFKDRNKKGQILLSGLNTNDFSSFEIQNLGLVISGFKDINGFSTFYSRCGNYQILGGFFINKKGTSLSYQLQLDPTITFKNVKVVFKYFLIDYDFVQIDSQIEITLNETKESIQIQQAQVSSATNICGFDKNDVIGEYQLKSAIPNTRKVFLQIGNNNIQSDDTIGNAVTYFGIREISLFLFDCDFDFCLECGSNQCTKCQEGYFLDSTQTCQKCDLSCKTCSNNSTCNLCREGVGLTLILSKCICSDKEYFDNSLLTCKPCANIKCLTCQQLNSQKCLTCGNNLGLYNDNCVSNCGPKLFIDQNICKPCISNCLNCSNSTSCSECDVGFYELTNCLLNCPDKYFQNTSLKKCQPCSDTNCLNCQKSISQCTKCDVDFLVSTQFTCVTSCQVGEFNENQSCKVCSSKIVNCQTCTDAKCLSCNSGYYLSLDMLQCVSTCPNGQVGVDSTGKCTQCYDQNCIQCDQIDLTYCKVCKNGIYFENNKCVTQCSPLYYGDQYFKCIPCNQKFSNCLKCSSDKCIACDQNSKNKYLHINSLSCIQQCYQNQYYSTSIQKCQSCAKVQNQCYQCEEQDPNNCVTCINSQSSKLYLQNKICVNFCSAENYPTTGQPQNECVSCSSKFPNCLTCTTKMCTKCIANFQLDQQTGECSNTCMQSQVNPSVCDSTVQCPQNCAVCRDSSECIVCNEQFYLMGKECVTNCIEGTYQDNNKNECSQCSSIFGQNCSKCIQTACQGTNCPEKLVYDYHEKDKATQCLEQCYDNLYPNSNKICTWCGNSNCKTCDPAKPTNCLSCYDQNKSLNYLLQCVSVCSQGFYQELASCLPCNTTCQNCTKDQCLLCKNQNQYIDPASNSCVDECKGDYFPGTNDKNNKQCIKCSERYEGCKQCDQYQCNICQINTQVYDNVNKKCSDNCPNKQYKSLGKCLPCININCKTCNESNSNICLTCDSSSLYPFFTEDGNCVQTCSSNEYLDTQNSKCIKCSTKYKEKCIECNAQTCIACSDSSFYISVFDDFSCVSPCPVGQYGDALTKKCAKCENKKCNTCNILKSTECIDCLPTGVYPMFFQKDCIEKCQDSYFPDQNNTCKPCTQFNAKCVQCNINNCTACTNTEELYLILDQNKCVESCPDHYYPSIVSNIRKCEQCTDPNCIKCDASQPNKCLMCTNGYYYNSIQCTTQCGQDQFGDDNLRQCMSCNVKYKNCIQCNKDKCLKCKKDLFLVEETQQCYEQCPFNYVDKSLVDPTYDQQENKKCQKCQNPNCDKCDFKNTSKCSSCTQDIQISKNAVLYNENCVEKCDAYLLKEKNYCYDECPKENAQLENPAKECVACSKFVENRKCVEKCKDSTFIDPKFPTICVDCEIHYSPNCNSCNINRCENCSNQTYLYENKCYSVCPNSTYIIDKTYQCTNKCDAPNVIQDITCQNSCSSGHYPSKENNQIICKICQEFCKECARSADTCIECHQGEGQDCFNEKSMEFYIKKVICSQTNENDYDKCDEIIGQEQQLASLFSYSSCITLSLSLIILFTSHNFLATFSLYYIQIFQLLSNYIILTTPKMQLLKEIALRHCVAFNIYSIFPYPFDQGKNSQKLTNFSLFDQVFSASNISKSSFNNNFYQLCILSSMIILILITIRKKNQVKIAQYLRNNFLNKLFMVSSNLLILSSIYQLKNQEFFGITDIVCVGFSILLIIILFIFNVKDIISFRVKSSLQETIYEKNILTQNLLQNPGRRIFWILFELRKILTICLIVLSPQSYISIWIVLPFNLIYLIYVSVYRPFERLYQTTFISVIEICYTILLTNLPFINTIQSAEGNIHFQKQLFFIYYCHNLKAFTYIALSIQSISGFLMVSLAFYQIVQVLRSFKFKSQSSRQKKTTKTKNDQTTFYEMNNSYNYPNNTTQLNINTLKNSFIPQAKDNKQQFQIEI